MEELLGEQVGYYPAIAAEYEKPRSAFPDGPELSAALDSFRRGA